MNVARSQRNPSLPPHIRANAVVITNLGFNSVHGKRNASQFGTRASEWTRHYTAWFKIYQDKVSPKISQFYPDYPSFRFKLIIENLCFVSRKTIKQIPLSDFSLLTPI